MKAFFNEFILSYLPGEFQCQMSKFKESLHIL